MDGAILYFSPTGGTETVCRLIGDALQLKKGYDLTLPEPPCVQFQPEDVCVIGVPAYGGRVPATALERLAKINGNGARAVIVVSYGNRAVDDTLLELQDVLSRQGFSVAAAIAAVTEHSIFRQYAAGRPNAQDRAELTGFAAKIKQKLLSGHACEPLILPGNRPFRVYDGVPLKPAANSKCNHCGLCAQRCPVGAIDPQAPSQTDKNRCISCMRCIAICPQQARRVNPLMLAAAAAKLRKAFAAPKSNLLFL